jgi:hypothetical protein
MPVGSRGYSHSHEACIKRWSPTVEDMLVCGEAQRLSAQPDQHTNAESSSVPRDRYSNGSTALVLLGTFRAYRENVYNVPLSTIPRTPDRRSKERLRYAQYKRQI